MAVIIQFLPLTTLSQEKRDWFLNGSVALSLLKDKHMALAPGLSGSVGTLPNLTDPFPVLFPYF